ncbi:IS3 family transposase [Alkalilimnicola sp. S0819]|uniref:IS3 family transposase n=1 Tax=Alkalilimnicola sp. S0819 TaxID=2613922 RepID=UPI001262708F|nr:IS3 family transposase [Alkalilimnicola sp. S0819]KAB7619486.1 IS3 family transposase [Alkalilimnicola sp. S0819]MPQ17684.1 IS3 family transposase [Alkalilimnicola sp. S0819]
MSLLEQRPSSLPRSRACEALGLSRTGTYARRRAPKRTAPSPQPRQLSPDEERAVLDLVNSERHQDASVRVIHASELNEGRMLASVSTIYRILRRHQQSRERRTQRPPQHHAVPRITARAPNEAWSWDITKLPTIQRGVYLNLYQVLDLFSRYPVAWMISRKENAALARHLFDQALSAHHIQPGTLVIHQDRGAPMIAHSYRDFLDAFGVRRSYSRPRVSNDNPYSEAHFKTLKYSPGYPGRFRDIDHARAWTAGFISEYKLRPHEGLAFYTPADVFEGRVETVHAQRQAALDAYYAEHPQRYPKGPPVASRPPTQVCINPEDGVTAAADTYIRDAEAGLYAHDAVITPEKMT